MKTTRKPGVLAIGQFPPPINGLTVITSRLTSELALAGYQVEMINTAVPSANRSLAFHALRAAKVSHALLLIVWHALMGKSRVCYFTAEGGLGLLYSIMIASCARLCGLRVYVHHHSFSYIVQYSRLMELLLAWAGEDAIHICLCAGMARSLACKYGRQVKSIVLSNAAFLDAAQFRLRPADRRHLVIGLLSNLNSEKGLHEFLEIVRIAKERRLPIRGVLAGPIDLKQDAAFLEAIKQEVGEYLDYRGPVYDDEKSRFFSDIDVFVFLTTYLNEAQPAVIFEAMARGIPVISNDRGCIRSQVAEAGLVFPEGADVVPDTLEALEAYCESSDHLAAHGEAALERFNAGRRQGQELVTNLFDASPSTINGQCPASESGDTL